MTFNDYQWLPMTTNDYQWLPMTTNDNQWLPMTTFWLYSYYFWLHSGYILAIFLATHSDYILATFLLHSDLKPIKLRILVSSWFHIKSSGKEKGGYKSLFVESEPRISFCFQPTFLPLVNTCHYQQSAVWYAESVLCVPGSGFLNTWKGKVLGSTLTFLSWATNKLSAIRSFRY